MEVAYVTLSRMRPTGTKSRWHRWYALAVRDQLATGAACVLLPLIEFSLCRCGLTVTLRWLRSTVRAERLGQSPTVTARCRRAVSRASRNGPVSGRCLSQSLTLWWLLRQQGVGSRLKVGAVRSTSNFDAHAWLENEAGVINDSADVNRRYPVSFAVLG